MSDAGREAAVLGIDLGTTEVKVGLVTLDGRLARARPGGLPDRDRRRERARRAGSGGVVGRADARPSRYLAASGPGGHPGGRDRRPRADARRGRRARTADPAGDHLAGHAGDGRAGGARARRRGSRAGRSAGLPAALWVERHEPDVAARDPLVPRDVGLPRASADRAARPRACVAGQPFPPARRVLDAAGIPARTHPGADPRRRGPRRAHPRGGATPRARQPPSRSSPGSSTPGRASTAPA